MNKLRNILVLLASLPHLVFTQNTIRGMVFDSATEEVVPWSIVVLQHTGNGTITDDKGYFELAVQDSVLSFSLMVTCIGYDTMIIAKKDIQLNSVQRFYISKRPVTMLEAGIFAIDTNKACTKNYGLTGHDYDVQQALDVGCESALFIANPDSANGIIRNISFFVSKEGYAQARFRARLYYVDPGTKGPGATMTETDIIMQSRKGNKWVTENISALGLPFPPEGFFVSMEWLPEAADHTLHRHPVNAPDIDIVSSGQSLGMSDEMQGKFTWYRDLTHPWILLQLHFNDTGPYLGNAMIHAEIFYPCAK